MKAIDLLARTQKLQTEHCCTSETNTSATEEVSRDFAKGESWQCSDVVQLPLQRPSYLTACSEEATTVLEKRDVQEARKTLDLAGSLRTNVTSASTLFSLKVRFCLLTTLVPIRTTLEGCSSCCRHLQQGPMATGATAERCLFGLCWFLALQFLCMAWMLARSRWPMPACLHSTGLIALSKP